eukprot:CAMPEP_0170069002 /NCGR_PEP_ID=MMETSP0019_2-20121128/7808_1 /TAXON_ID=98059 /ORGANISM="Dinobryon sp., Strain UTEXLB2267" /LENGTH=692 /DNA_ID=CAMNT_0010276873 /DNA_START=292 /DNA_END=2370 /DNA_ORIENTATION=-
MIRRFKITESSAVTPNEFRHTLIKFGIILAQPLVDRIFNVFDSDRSGTMDFDEFATWIMNSEFHPKVKEQKAPTDPESPEQQLRKKFLNCVKEHKKVFENMNRQVSFLEFISDVNRKNMKLTEKEARTVFQIMDPNDSGFVESAALIRWAETGRDDYRAAFVRPPEIQANSIEELCSKVVGRNTKALENAFSHVQKGSNTRLPFEEFRRCLLNAGVGKNIYDVHQLFQALGGSTNGNADIDLFFKHLSPIYVDPRTEGSNKTGPTSIVSIGRADRHLRDALRKSYKLVKQEIIDADPSTSGFIQPDELYRILVKRCTPLTFQDFRFLTQQMKKGTGGIDYNHFLQAYNPTQSYHELDGTSLQRKTTDLSNSMLNTLPPPSTANNNNTLSKIGSMKALGTLSKSKLRQSAVDDISVGTQAFSSSKSNKSGGDDLKRIWHMVLKDCHRADPERNGQVSRTVFISALQKADTSKSMSADAMNKLADEYILSNGLVNYLYCFRNYLNEMTGMEATEMNNNTMNKSATFSSTLPMGMKTVELRPLHPWDFEYKREKHPGHPYWQSASALPKDMQKLASTINPPPLPAAHEKSASELSATERDALLSQYNPQTLAICAKSYKTIAPMWRQVRSQLKKKQVIAQKGVILATNFIAILEENGIILDKKEIGTLVKVFRGPGMQDVVKYDEFLRVCLLMKD